MQITFPERSGYQLYLPIFYFKIYEIKIVENWLKENKVSVKSGLKSEIQKSANTQCFHKIIVQ